MFDTHVNLHSEAFADDLDAVMERARRAGVSRLLAICDRFDNFYSVLSIADNADDIWCTTGTHPHHAKDFQHLTAEDLITAAAAEKVVAIGETGLDLYYGHSELEQQIKTFRTHIEASQATDLPLVIHCREADELTAEILAEMHEKAPFTPLLHCYTGGIELAKLGLSLGGYVSVSGILSFRNAKEVRRVISEIPLDRIVVETDCPYLAPVPHRGRRNEPAYLIDVCAALGSLHGLSAITVAHITEANALRLFHRVT